MKWKDLSKKEKIKKIAKYTVNSLNMINAILLGLSKIWGWNIANISATIIVFTGAISLYLVNGKLWNMNDDIDIIGDENE